MQELAHKIWTFYDIRGLSSYVEKTFQRSLAYLFIEQSKFNWKPILTPLFSSFIDYRRHRYL